MSSRSISSPVAESWSKSDALIARASKGRLVVCPNQSITREDLITNEEVICPVLKVLGVRTTIDAIYEHVEIFLHWARPRGKNEVPRPSSELHIEMFCGSGPGRCMIHMYVNKLDHFAIFCINRCPYHIILYIISLVNRALHPATTGQAVRFESWKIKRLVSIFSRHAKRGHYPREAAIRRIYQEAEIPLPSAPGPQTAVQLQTVY